MREEQQPVENPLSHQAARHKELKLFLLSTRLTNSHKDKSISKNLKYLRFSRGSRQLETKSCSKIWWIKLNIEGKLWAQFRMLLQLWKESWEAYQNQQIYLLSLWIISSKSQLMIKSGLVISFSSNNSSVRWSKPWGWKKVLADTRLNLIRWKQWSRNKVRILHTVNVKRKLWSTMITTTNSTNPYHHTWPKVQMGTARRSR